MRSRVIDAAIKEYRSHNNKVVKYVKHFTAYMTHCRRTVVVHTEVSNKKGNSCSMLLLASITMTYLRFKQTFYNFSDNLLILK